MKLFEFNMLFSMRKSQTKVIVARKNIFLKRGSVLTARTVEDMILDQIEELYPYEYNSNPSKQNKRRYNINSFRSNVIKSLELKNQ